MCNIIDYEIVVGFAFSPIQVMKNCLVVTDVIRFVSTTLLYGQITVFLNKHLRCYHLCVKYDVEWLKTMVLFLYTAGELNVM